MSRARIHFGIEAVSRVRPCERRVGAQAPEIDVDANLRRDVRAAFARIRLVVHVIDRRDIRQAEAARTKSDARPRRQRKREVRFRVDRFIEDVVVNADVLDDQAGRERQRSIDDGAGRQLFRLSLLRRDHGGRDREAQKHQRHALAPDTARHDATGAPARRVIPSCRVLR